jgi:hypothetical protein
MNILQALDDPNVFSRHFCGGTWDAWRAFLAALFALPMTPKQIALYQKHTGRAAPPSEPLREAWLCCGRRSGKSLVLATVAIFLACFKDWRPHLAAGEVATVMVIAADRRQARVIMRYCLGLLRSVPMLRQLIEAQTQESITLRNRVVIEVHTASFRSTRGYTIAACLLDELAYFAVDEFSASPDAEVINAIRPGLATVPGSMLLCASSPHARRGALWDAHRRHFAQDGDPVLVWQAATREMNASVPQGIIDAAMEEDPARAQAEWGAQFRTDVESFVAREAAEACVAVGVRERSPVQGVRYHGFVDPSGGSADSMTLAIGHREKDVVVLDALRERRPPFSPEAVVAEFAELLKSYRISKVGGDRYAGEWPRERFREHGIGYEPAQKPKSDLYRDMLPVINSRKLDLLDDARLLAQLVGLEQRTARGGKDSIDHAPGVRDDLINAVAGICAAICAAAAKGNFDLALYTSMAWVDGDPLDGPAAAAPARSASREDRVHYVDLNADQRAFAAYVASGGYRRPY